MAATTLTIIRRDLRLQTQNSNLPCDRKRDDNERQSNHR